MRKDKVKVLDEQWDDERVASFLEPRPGDGESADYAILLRAYQSMRDDDFARFVPMFVAAGRKIDAVGPDGRMQLPSGLSGISDLNSTGSGEAGLSVTRKILSFEIGFMA